MPRRTNEMPKRIITKLSDEQEALLPIYRDKWVSIAKSTESIDREKVAAIIKNAYRVSDFHEPEILFYSSPLMAIEKWLAVENFRAYLGRDIHTKFRKRVIDFLKHQIKRQLDERLFSRLLNQIQHPEFPHYWTESNPLISPFPSDFSIYACLEFQLIAALDKLEIEFSDLGYFIHNLTRPAGCAIWGCMLDFCISVLNLQHDKKKWKVYQELIQYCSFLFLYEKVCLACDRPCKLSFDSKNRLHAEGEPAMQFPDGYSVYACHGRHPSEEE